MLVAPAVRAALLAVVKSAALALAPAYVPEVFAVEPFEYVRKGCVWLEDAEYEIEVRGLGAGGTHSKEHPAFWVVCSAYRDAENDMAAFKDAYAASHGWAAAIATAIAASPSLGGSFTPGARVVKVEPKVWRCEPGFSVDARLLVVTTAHP